MCELSNFYSPWKDQKKYDFLIISRGIEVNYSLKFA